MFVRNLTIAAVLASAGLSPVAAQSKADFSGTWKVNTEKSDPMGGMGGGGGGGGGGSMAMGMPATTITQNGAQLMIETKFGDQTRTMTYNLDGKESVNQGRNGETKSTVSWDGASLVVSSTNANGNTSKEVRSLSADGKTMTVVRTSQSPNGEMTRKMVYDKQ